MKMYGKDSRGYQSIGGCCEILVSGLCLEVIPSPRFSAAPFEDFWFRPGPNG